MLLTMGGGPSIELHFCTPGTSWGLSIESSHFSFLARIFAYGEHYSVS